MLKRLCLVCSCLIAAPAGGHPHVFVDTTLRLMTDGAQNANGIEVSWVYDDFFTLLIFEDMGLDRDGDAQLTAQELEKLHGFDMVEWPPGFEGDLYMYHDGQKIALDRPISTGIEVIDGRIKATHERYFRSVPAQGLEIFQYDPTYYVAYQVTGGVEVPEPCRAQVIKPDLDAANRAVAELTEGEPEMMFEVIEVGIHYADRVQITCAQG